ncbi:hypothetical protein AAFF_G00014410 [Aldrovandia affinis]|uniref:Uncharacterized protein n=1 Tax=Aldrovandia affinis TaxID=143900 RepID=A0AAD7S6C0_9TELE|nr:hypothetical protein AAFF_G00014410 [Aldrovandia affinis]
MQNKRPTEEGGQRAATSAPTTPPPSITAIIIIIIIIVTSGGTPADLILHGGHTQHQASLSDHKDTLNAEELPGSEERMGSGL